MKNKILLIILIALPFAVISQNCVEHLNIQKSGVRYPWKYDAQSKSGLFIGGKTSQINVVCNEGKDYNISFLTSTALLKYANIKVTDENGKEYFTIGVDNNKKKDLESKRQLMISLENQKIKIKTGKKKIEIDANINSLKLEIEKSQQEIDKNTYQPKTNFSFTPAETMNLIISISISEECTSKGCVGALIINKKAEKSGF
ncbi:MAG: hypothetical protein HY951_07570 [Bacteroidia bacterium]|nr:hypothetical protein [Bacteroidia bacterium]